MIITISNILGMLIISILYLINITMVQKLLLNYSKNKSNYFLIPIYLLLGIIFAVSKEVDNNDALLISTIFFSY